MSEHNNNNDYEYDDHQQPPGNQLSPNVSDQDVEKVVRDITDNIRMSQDLFDSSTPGSSNNRMKGTGSSGAKKKKPKTHTGILPRQTRPAKQNIFNNDWSGPNNSKIIDQVENTEHSSGREFFFLFLVIAVGGGNPPE